jgi:hypothetical protein
MSFVLVPKAILTLIHRQINASFTLEIVDGPMTTKPRSPNEPTIQQLWERERTLRILASTALTLEESTALATLIAYYEALEVERQRQGAQTRLVVEK